MSEAVTDTTTPPTAGPREVVVEVIDLHKSFGSVEVLKGISTVIHRGEVVCVIGPSGSGKSTLLCEPAGGAHLGDSCGEW
jgi:polar amino acid transport system ATP-binding protein